MLKFAIGPTIGPTIGPVGGFIALLAIVAFLVSQITMADPPFRDEPLRLDFVRVLGIDRARAETLQSIFVRKHDACRELMAKLDDATDDAARQQVLAERRALELSVRAEIKAMLSSAELAKLDRRLANPPVKWRPNAS
jgi:hypothetical protein